MSDKMITFEEVNQIAGRNVFDSYSKGYCPYYNLILEKAGDYVNVAGSYQANQLVKVSDVSKRINSFLTFNINSNNYPTVYVKQSTGSNVQINYLYYGILLFTTDYKYYEINNILVYSNLSNTWNMSSSSSYSNILNLNSKFVPNIPYSSITKDVSSFLNKPFEIVVAIICNSTTPRITPSSVTSNFTCKINTPSLEEYTLSELFTLDEVIDYSKYPVANKYYCFRTSSNLKDTVWQQNNGSSITFNDIVEQFGTYDETSLALPLTLSLTGTAYSDFTLYK